MAVIVLIHGIAQERESADTLENQWLPALAGGVRAAGFPDIADRLWRGQGGPGAIEARMAYYGHLFRRPGLQGDDPEEFSAQEEQIAEQLAEAWLANAAIRSSRPEERETAARELAYVQYEFGEEAGPGAMVRKAINSLSRLKYFAVPGMAFAERFVKRALSQVTRYLTENDIRKAAQESVLGKESAPGQVSVPSLVGPETKIVIGHSLGSIIAYEIAHLMQQPLDLLLTLGSPLGLRNIVYERLRPQPPTFPTRVRRWVNVADHEDFIAAEPDLESLFSSGMPPESVMEAYTVDKGAQPHDARFYLTTVEVGRAIAQVLGASGY